MSTQAQVQHTNGQAIGVTVRELKADLSNFVQTRLQMLMQEMKQKLSAIKLAAPMFGIALIFGFVGFLGLTAALVYIIGIALGMGWAMLIVGAAYVIIAGGAAFIGWSQIAENGMAPKRTMEVLKQDQAWLQQEARSA